jgi:hypothetical protein
VILKDESLFVVTSTLIISDCIWSLGGINCSQIHFTLTSGKFKCERTVVSPYINDDLRFLYCSNLNNDLSISNLSFKNIKINSDRYHLTLRGDTNISDSVWLFLFI